MPLIQLVHVTATYSNAVLTAILPHVSDYAQKLDLPIPQPITMSQVAHFNASRIQGEVGGGLWLTNNYWFTFHDGYVSGFRLNKNNPFFDDDPASDWPKYAFGPINMTTNEAIDFIRQSITKLGYNLKTLRVDSPPDFFSGGEILKNGQPFPYCEVEWRKEWKSQADVTNLYSVHGQVDMERKKLIELSISGRGAWKPNPPVSVTPELEKDFRKRTMKSMTLNTNAPAHLQPPSSLQKPGAALSNSPPASVDFNH